MNNIKEKLLRGDHLTEYEISELVYESEKIDEEVGDHRRWVANVNTVIKVQDRLFMINWDRALTESQESSWQNQPVEVESYEEQITVTKYREI